MSECLCKCHTYPCEWNSHCAMCNNDYSDLCTGGYTEEDYSDWEAEGGYCPKDDTPKRKRNR